MFSTVEIRLWGFRSSSPITDLCRSLSPSRFQSCSLASLCLSLSPFPFSPMGDEIGFSSIRDSSWPYSGLWAGPRTELNVLLVTVGISVYWCEGGTKRSKFGCKEEDENDFLFLYSIFQALFFFFSLFLVVVFAPTLKLIPATCHFTLQHEVDWWMAAESKLRLVAMGALSYCAVG